MTIWTKPIVSCGINVTQEQQMLAWNEWCREGDLGRQHLAYWLEESGIPQQLGVVEPRYPSKDIARRMLQIARKSGVITFIGKGRWELVREAAK